MVVTAAQNRQFAANFFSRLIPHLLEIFRLAESVVAG